MKQLTEAEQKKLASFEALDLIAELERKDAGSFASENLQTFLSHHRDKTVQTPLSDDLKNPSVRVHYSFDDVDTSTSKQRANRLKSLMLALACMRFIMFFRKPKSPTALFTCLELFSYILPKKARAIAFEPAYNDLKSDYLETRRFKSKRQQRWLKFCFSVRGVAMIAGCFGVLLGEKGRKIILFFLPEPLRKLWRS